jgi:acetyl-CoA acetyltransferase
MASHPFSNVAIAAVHNTRQGRVLEGHDSFTISLEAARGVLAKAGVDGREVDALFSSSYGSQLVYELGIGPVWEGRHSGMGAVLVAASAVAAGLCQVVLIADGEAGVYVDRESTAPWLRPQSEFVSSFGIYTAVEYALIAQRHMAVFGTKPEHLAEAAATIRNNGHVNPAAVFHGRGPFTRDDILASRMVADPFHLLDCAMNSEGGAAILVMTRERALELETPPVYILGGGCDRLGPPYKHPPTWDLTGRSVGEEIPNGYIGRRAARQAFKMAGLSPSDVDCCEFYDPFSFDIIRQFEAFEFCGPGEGGDFIMGGTIGPGGRFPICTDGGTMSFSHGGHQVQILQRVIRGVEQLQGSCETCQVPGAEVAICTAAGAGALFGDVILLGKHQP